ncbi:MAG: DUF981 family protein [Streptosporangiales bacterium]|nr:DUF981 family protein [Streptosporangiales bacterium]
MREAVLAMATAAAPAEPLNGVKAYNTIMAVAAGTGLLLIVALGRKLFRREAVLFEGYAVAFAILGFILVTTGLHMTLTWPLNPDFPFDNIIFGEPSLAFGTMLLGAAFVLWRLGRRMDVWFEPVEVDDDMVTRVRGFAGPISVFAASIGLGCIGIAFAGVIYQLFAAPPQEPISGLLADYPMIEATFISATYAIIGIGAVLFPFALRKPTAGLVKTIGVCWTIGGLIWFFFGALNYFTHIGLYVNLM